MADQQVVSAIAELRSLAENPHKAEWRGKNEREWCEFAMSRSDEWLPVVGIKSFGRVTLEYQVRHHRSSGAPRFDAVGHCGDVRHIIEAKTKSTASELMAGVGQLLFYGTVARAMGWNVGRLILISPAWPMMFAETVAQHRLPVDVVRLQPDSFTAIRAETHGCA